MSCRAFTPELSPPAWAQAIAVASPMDALATELAALRAERRRLQKTAWKQHATEARQREQALQAATIAFCHVPTAGATLARATLRRFPNWMDADVDACARAIEDRFLQTPVAVLAEWLDWAGDVPASTLAEAKRLAQDARLVSWVDEQNSAQGVAPPPQFVWEKKCAFAVDHGLKQGDGAATWRPAKSQAAKKWMQRFRRRWNLGLGRLPAKDLLPADAMQEKVTRGVRKKTAWCQTQARFGVHLADLILGPQYYFT